MRVPWQGVDSRIVCVVESQCHGIGDKGRCNLQHVDCQGQFYPVAF